MNFRVHAYQLSFRALQPLYFPPGKTVNLFRGALGLILRQAVCAPVAECPSAAACPRAGECHYATLFEPRRHPFDAGPSGYTELPRPFVLRASQLDGTRLSAGDRFPIGLHVFERTGTAIAPLAGALAQLEWTGLGPGRPRVELEQVAPLLGGSGLLELPLDPAGNGTGPIRRIRVQFLSPTEIRTEGKLLREPAFGAIFARARDRVSTLRDLYQDGPLEIDFRGMGERARQVRLVRSAVTWSSVERWSSKTGQRHPLAGFVGEAEYEGDLTEFLPILEAACWTGVGRHTGWGQGALKIDVVGSLFPPS